MYKKKKTGIIGVVITVIILVTVVIVSNMEIDSFSHIGGAMSSFVMPVQNGLTYLKNKITGNSTFFSDINTLKTDVAIVDENNEEEEIEIKDESNEKVKSKVNTLKQTSKPQTNTSTLQNKPQQKPTEPEVVPEVPEEKPTEPEVVPEVPEEKPTEPEVLQEVPSTGLVEQSLSNIETPSVEKQFDIN